MNQSKIDPMKPYKALFAGVLQLAIKDALAGRREAAVWVLKSPISAEYLRWLDINPVAFRERLCSILLVAARVHSVR